MSHILILILGMMFSFTTFAQQNKVDIKAKMAFFSFMEGNWEGIGYYTRQNGWVDTVYQQEVVNYQLNGGVLTVAGTGKDKKDQMVFNAYATIYFSLSDSAYHMQAFKDDGAMTVADVEIIAPQHFIWRFSPNTYTNIKYEIQLNEKGDWIEIGYFSSDQKNWTPFFNMELKKQVE